MLGIVLELITDDSQTFPGLWDCTLCVKQCDSLCTDPSAAFRNHTKVISHSLLYLRPELLQPFHFSTSLSHFYGGVADLFASVELT